MASSRGGRFGVAAVVAAALVLIGSSPAWAESPVDFGSGPIVDTVGALGGDAEDVLAAIEQTADDTGRQLYVAYVSEFTDPEQADTWANDTAVANNMGAEDYLLAVAVDGRAYYLSAADNASVPAGELDRISLEVIEPELRDEDWSGAAIAAAEALGGGSGGSGGSGWGWIWFLVIAGAVVVIVVVVLSRRRKRTGPADASGGPGASPPPVPLEELRRRAGSALIAADDAVKTSEEELGFATASYGDEATAEFRAALDSAKSRVAEAFRLQQLLDDDQPDTDAQRREHYEGILAATGSAEELLDEQAEAFDALRDLERNAPAELERVRAEATTTLASVAPAEERLRALGAEYAASALAGVLDNPEQAASRLAFADEELTRAGASIAASQPAEAAVAIRAAEEAVDQAGLLTAAVARLADELAAADRALADGLADLEHDVRTARELGGEAAPLADRTDAAIAVLRSVVGTTGRDPIAANARLAQANAEIDAAIASTRSAAEQAARAQALLQRSVDSARVHVQTAEDYVTARRGAVGTEARTRLATAAQLLAQAQTGSDAAIALQSAQQSERLAAEALSLARRDVEGFGGAGGAQGGFGGQGGNVMGAVLGGILIDSMLGGGSRGRGRSGGFGGGFGGGGFGGLGGGSRGGSGRSAGSFGGGATRGRRGSGGRF
jgi:hypothetical protein